MKIKIDGTEAVEIASINDYGYTNVELEDGTEWYLFEDIKAAGKAAREYWKDLAENDPTEFTRLVGEKTLVNWGLGRYAGPGSTKVKSLDEWLDLWLDRPEEHFAGYDGVEYEYEIEIEEGENAPDFEMKGVCYRNN
jgi:hypothetical protein